MWHSSALRCLGPDVGTRAEAPGAERERCQSGSQVRVPPQELSPPHTPPAGQDVVAAAVGWAGCGGGGRRTQPDSSFSPHPSSCLHPLRVTCSRLGHRGTISHFSRKDISIRRHGLKLYHAIFWTPLSSLEQKVCPVHISGKRGLTRKRPL